MLHGMADERAIVDLPLVHRVETEHAAIRQCAMHAGQACAQALQPCVVVDRIEETGDQVQRLVHLEAGHVLPAEVRFGAALSGEVEHRLVDVQTGAAIAEIEEVPHVRAGTAGQVQVPPALVAEQLVQATHAVALRLVVDVGAHQVVIVGQVGVQRGGGHGRQGPAAKGAAWYPRPGPCRRKNRHRPADRERTSVEPRPVVGDPVPAGHRCDLDMLLFRRREGRVQAAEGDRYPVGELAFAP